MPDHISLEGKVAIVTGGARGLGKVMTETLIALGATVFIVARSADQVAATLSELRGAGGRCDGMSADVSDAAACRAVVARTVETLGEPDILVNNAAVGFSGLPGDLDLTNPPPIHLIDPAAIEISARINFLGPWYMYHAVAAGMIARGYGRIVNISTSLPTMRIAGVYGALKAGLEVATVNWANGLSGTGVTANVLLPGGGTDTAMVPGGNVGNRAKPFAAGKGPLGMEGRNTDLLPPEIMGPPIAWLASEQSAAYNGRRFVARDWDPDLPYAEAAERAMQTPAETTVLM